MQDVQLFVSLVSLPFPLVLVPSLFRLKGFPFFRLELEFAEEFLFSIVHELEAPFFILSFLSPQRSLLCLRLTQLALQGWEPLLNKLLLNLFVIFLFVIFLPQPGPFLPFFLRP